MILLSRPHVHILIDDCAYCIFKCIAGEIKDMYTVLSEDAHGDVDVKVLSYSETMKRIPYMDGYDKAIIAKLIKQLK